MPLCKELLNYIYNCYDKLFQCRLVCGNNNDEQECIQRYHNNERILDGKKGLSLTTIIIIMFSLSMFSSIWKIIA